MPEVSQRLGVPAATLRAWLELPVPGPGSGPDGERRLELRDLPASPAFETVKGGASGQRWTIRQAAPAMPRAEEVRRMIVLLLDLPLAWEAPDWARDFVAHLVEAELRRDEDLLAGLTAELFEAQRSWLAAPLAMEEASRRRSGPLTQETVERFRPVSDRGWGKESVRREWERAAKRPAMQALLETLGGDPEAGERLEKGAFLDSLAALAGDRPGPLQGEVDLLVVVRRLLEKEVADLAERSGLARERMEKVLRLLRRTPSTAVPSLRWLLEQGWSRGGRTAAGDALPPRSDVAWPLLQRLAELELPSPLAGPGSRPESRDSPRRLLEELVVEEGLWHGEGAQLEIYRNVVEVQRLADHVHQVEIALREQLRRLIRPVRSLLSKIRPAYLDEWPVTDELIISEPQVETVLLREESESVRLSMQETRISELRDEAEEDRRRGRERLRELRHLLTTPFLAADPELAVQMAGRVCRNRGTLSWQACLTLANSRARCHRYLDGDGAAFWQVMADIRPGADGELEVPFAVVEQPLSPRFRHRFEAEGLAGRVEILCRLVRYATRPRGSRLAITEADAWHQVGRREEELWQSLGEVTV